MEFEDRKDKPEDAGVSDAKQWPEREEEGDMANKPDMEDGTEEESVCLEAGSGDRTYTTEDAAAKPHEAGEAPAQESAPARKNKAFLGVLIEYLQAVVMAFLIAIVIMAFLGRSYMVEGASMEKTLFNGERVLVEKISYYIASPKRGDIVVLMNPRQQKYGNWLADTFGFVKDIFVSDMSSRPYIKRIIGVAGDKVEIKGGAAYLNDERLNELYISEEAWWDYGPYQVPEGYVFVMGDNRNHSDDSRGSVGFLKTDRILGKAVARFWPLNKLSVFTRPDALKNR